MRYVSSVVVLTNCNCYLIIFYLLKIYSFIKHHNNNINNKPHNKLLEHFDKIKLQTHMDKTRYLK